MSNAHEGTAIVTGEVIEVGNREAIGKKGTGKTTFVVECSSNDAYPCPVPVEAFGDELSSEASNLAQGDSVRVKCWVRGREWHGKYYSNLAAQKDGIEVLNRASPQSSPPATDNDTTDFPTDEPDDELGF